LIVAAAKAAGREFLLTEDLQAGQDLEGVKVVNPFATEPASFGGW
jgi:predicted nucleic acid-binding protein